MRDRLIELLNKKYDHFCDQCGVNKDSHYTENLADYLLANGVIVPPCKVGDTVYEIYRDYTECSAHGEKIIHCIDCEYEGECDSKPFLAVRELNFSRYNFYPLTMAFGKTVFLTKEEAEQALKEGAK